MEQTEKIIEAINGLNRITWFDWIQMIASIIFSAINCWVAYLTFRLQRKIKLDDDKEKRLKDIDHVSSVYYFLNDIINKVADTEFEYTTFDNIVVEGKKFMEDINYLKTKYITNKDFSFLRELYVLYDDIKRDPKTNQKNFKILYKKVIDANIEPQKIPVYRNENKFDYIVSIQLLMIIKKLEFVLNSDITFTDDNITMSINGRNVTIIKNYDKKHYLEYKNDVITGEVNKYEMILHFGDIISTSYELTYSGSVKNDVPNGKGEYYYYTSENGFNKGINSCDLNRKGVNYDSIAQDIKNYLATESTDGHFIATFKGSFDNGTIKSGVLKYKLTSSDSEKEISIGK